MERPLYDERAGGAGGWPRAIGGPGWRRPGAIMVLLGGLFFAHGLQCAAAQGPDASASTHAASTHASPPAASPPAASAAESAPAADILLGLAARAAGLLSHAGAHAVPAGQGGLPPDLLLACAAILLAVLGLVPWRSTPLRYRLDRGRARPSGRRTIHRRRPPAPSLSTLCVSRT